MEVLMDCQQNMKWFSRINCWDSSISWKVRLTTSGTEATMSAVRLARAYTQRNKILKFEGCYHGHSDALLVKSGSGLLTEGYQDSNGITDGVLKDTLTLPFGDIEKVKKFWKVKM